MTNMDDARVALLRALSAMNEIIPRLDLHDTVNDITVQMLAVSDTRKDVRDVTRRLRAFRDRTAEDYLEAQGIHHAMETISQTLWPAPAPSAYPDWYPTYLKGREVEEEPDA